MPPRSDFDNGIFSAVDEHHVYEQQQEESKVTAFMAAPAAVTASKKRVTFFPSVEVYPVIHINDYLISEVIDTWYDKSELSEIRVQCRRTINAMENGTLSATTAQDGCCCSRGLENRTKEASQQKLQYRVACWDAVLDEQEQQYAECVSDPERLANLYHFYSSQCERAAQQMAALDAKFAQKCT